ncbi:MAG: class I SAM-dependent methyltransferase [Candidatus Hodarchaeota archaeon]
MHLPYVEVPKDRARTLALNKIDLNTGDVIGNVSGEPDSARFKHIDFDKGEPTMRYGHMNGWIVLEQIVPIVLYFRPHCIVEIGSGASTIYLARFAEKFGVKFYSCDKSPRKNRTYIKNHIHVQKFSKDFIEEFDDTPAVVLIDADHAYDVAKMEFDFFFERLVPGGVIFLHDTLPPVDYYLAQTACGDVYRLRQELEKRTDEMDCFTWPYTANWCGLTMVLKKEKERPYWEK